LHDHLLVAMIQGLLTGPAFAAPWGVVTAFGALGLILVPVLFAQLAALTDLYDEAYRLSRKE
jgi:hypothetical protein